MRSMRTSFFGSGLKWSRWKCACFSALVVITLLLATQAHGQSKAGIVSGVISEKNILVLEDDFAKLIRYIMDKNDATLSTESDEKILRQIAEASRIQARTSILLIRQNNEIIRLLKRIARKR